RYFFMPGRDIIHKKPENEPKETHCACSNKGHLPAISNRQPRHHKRCDNRSDIGSAIEDAGCKRPFLLRKPLSNHFDRCREIPGFGNTQGSPEGCESESCGSESVQDRCNTPEKERDGITQFTTDLVDHASNSKHPEC